MTRRVLRAMMSALLAMALVTPSDAKSPQPGQQAGDVTPGSGSIAGTVVSAAGRPLRGVRLVLSGRPGGASTAAAGAVTAAGGGPTALTAISDAQGRFSFVALPPGRFVIEATRDGFLPASYGQKKPGKVGTPIELANGQRVEITVPMTRGSAITGTIVDEFGDPLVRANVRLLSMVTNQNGVRRMRVVAQVPTDDRGVYRFFQLAPDRYLVSATPVLPADRALLSLSEAASMSSLSVADVFFNFFNGDFFMEAGGGPGLVEIDGAGSAWIVGPLNDADGSPAPEPEGFAPTYHPMSTTATHSVTVAADGLNEHVGVDIRVLPVRTATIRGTVVGLPSTGIPVQVLLHTVEPGEEPTSLTAAVDPNGEFTLPSVAPGQYTVYAQTLPGSPSDRTVVTNGAVQTAIPAARVAAFDRLHGRTTITVDGPNTAPVVVALRPGRSISGRVVRDLANPPTGAAARAVTRISITPSPVPAGLPAFNTSPQVDVDADGLFVLPGIRPGRYFLRASGPGTVRSVMWNGVETLDFPLEVTAESDIVEVVMTLTDKLSDLSGAVTDTAGRPVYEATVIAVATDSRYWTLGTRRVVTSQPAADGRYTFRGLPPGEYRLAVVTDFELENRLDPVYLRQLFAISTTVTVGEGGTVRQDLKLR
jgi:uncharacterized protein (DUF2141 family)